MKVQKDDLKELMALLPSSIKTTKEFTTKTKMVIAQLILMNGLDKVKNDGYFFVTNQKLVEELGITEKTIIKILRNLEQHNFISRKVGKRGEASEYIVNEDIIKSFGNTVKIHCKKENEITVSNYSNNLENTVINYSNKINDLILIINDLTKSNKELIDKVNQLEITVLNYSNKIENYSTDTETDSESDIEKESYINNINKILENIYNKKLLNNIKEKTEEVGFVDNPTSISEIEDTESTPMGNGTNDEDEALDMIFGKEEKIENNTAFQPTEVGMQIIEEKETPSMKEKFEKNLNLLLNRLNDSKSLTDLEDKVVKLCDWIERCESSYTPSELESIKEKVSSTYVSIHNRMFEEIEELERQSMEDIENDFFNNIECNPHTAKTIAQTKKEEKEQKANTKTKEQFIADLKEYKNTIMNQENLEDAKQQFKMFCNLKDKTIREYELIPMVADIIKEIDTQIEANKTFLTTFNIQNNESITDNKKTQEIASCEATKGIVGYRVEEEYPF